MVRSRPLAVADLAVSPGALLLAANSETSRAAALDLGVLFPGGEEASRLRRLADTYQACGGARARVCIALVQIGGGAQPPDASGRAPSDAESQFRAASAAGMRQASGFRRSPFVGRSEPVASELSEHLHRSGATAVNIRVAPLAASPGSILEQIAEIGTELIPVLRVALTRP